MRQLARLGSLQTDALFMQYAQTRDQDVRNELVSRHLYIADSIARRYSGRNIDYDDLYQVASLALIQAVDRYSIDKGVKFSTFATPTLLGVIKNYFRDHVRNIRMPRRAGDLLRRVDKAREELYGILMQTPTPAQIAQHLGVTTEEVLEALETGEALNITSLNIEAGENGEGQLMDVIGDEDNAYDQVDLQDFLSREMGKLSEAEQFIIKERYWAGRSQRDIAAELNVSQMYISRIERKIISRFRQAIS